MVRKEVSHENFDWIASAQDRTRRSCVANTVIIIREHRNIENLLTRTVSITFSSGTPFS
jgi:hypothetical protein